MILGATFEPLTGRVLETPAQEHLHSNTIHFAPSFTVLFTVIGKGG